MSKYKTPGYRGSYDCSKSEEREGRSCVRYKCGLFNTIQDVLRQRPGWVEVKDDGEWDFHWCDVGWLRENFDHSYMEEHVRINHFRNHYELTRKNLMVKNLKRYRKNLERDVGRMEASKCEFFPCTFALPSEYHLFVEEFKRNPGSTWIMKPVAKSQGKGIFLFRKLKDIMDWKKDGTRSEEQKDATQVESYVAQRYIENPYLINGRKFDLRVYVLVTSYVPLKAWLYRDGFARFSSTRFSLSSIDDRYMHLTNVAVQKTAPDYDPEKGCKWQIQQLRRYLTAKHGREMVEILFKEMDNIFVRSLQSVQKVIINDKHCFELYGYDILLDQNLKPWLIEVNASPSHSPSSREDYEMKCRLLEDTLNVVDMEGRLTGKEKRVGGYDLMWNDGPVYKEDVNLETFGSSCFTANTHLGCVNDREKHLRHLLKPFPGQKRM
ncbi:probable tubulin polyglutamylase TTLL9 isoform X2 [Micropterus salmoides]|uniref:probable tubulin polyglutamylase TTLL9 isoform X2 n=1 Tax=Micropterus salmoides TaxID=27706 RepID=UPI0018EAE4B2|nr:probable tubulin polyglutamylase TTLL9 isoform X2 [Micropterus salmoides]XP_045912673.1 probable tubulin polyglutamylase TTLL9 isoform X1 [Micropterus dolomieu]